MKDLINPSFWLAVLLGAIALFGSGYSAGGKHARSECIASQAKAQQASQAAADNESARRESVAAQREGSREQIRVVYRTIKEKADESVKNNPGINDCGLDADGLRLWNAANSGDTAPLSGEPDYTLPAAATGQIGKVGGLALQPRRDNGAGSAVPRSTEQAGSVREGWQ